MHIALYSPNLKKQNHHLMPWRMIFEVSSHICKAGHTVTVLSNEVVTSAQNWFSDEVEVKQIKNPSGNDTLTNLLDVIKNEKIEVLFWPFAWYGAKKKAFISTKVTIPLIWYLPASYYCLNYVLRSIPFLSIKDVMPYMVQAIYPKPYLAKRLASNNHTSMITFSEFNRRAIIKAGFPSKNVITIMPGKSDICICEGSTETFEKVKQQLKGNPFYLFFGPLAKIRGLDQLLKAFRLVLSQYPDLRLVCLFRSDPWINRKKFQQKIQQTEAEGKIICLWESVSRKDLSVFLEACYAVVLPFLLVPSEIPLAVIETAGHAKPVITTGPNGTAEFVEKFGLSIPPANFKALAAAMMLLFEDKLLYSQKCQMAKNVFDALPTWPDVAKSWLEVAQKAAAEHENR